MPEKFIIFYVILLIQRAGEYNLNQNNLDILTEEYNKDFNTALNIYINSYSHEYLIELLKNGTIPEKQASAIKLDKINTEEDAEIFMENLTGCDGKIREAVSFRLPEFVKNNPHFYENFSQTFLDAIIDINGNICRNTIKALEYLKNNETFTNKFIPELIQKTIDIIEPIKKFDLQEGKYKINKVVFKLYWYLETIAQFTDIIPEDTLLQIVNETKNIQDYTIREKTAKILSNINSIPEFVKIKQELKNDQNYYVRRI